MTTNVMHVTAAPSLLPLLRREMFCARPPLFSREGFLSGIDNGRDRLIRAQSGV
jgi:hypothetical protein